MKWHRINALLYRHLYLIMRSFPRLLDIFYWPVADLLLWGFLSLYIEKFQLNSVNIVTILLGGIVLWGIFYQAQQAISVAFLEEVWEKNLLNIFVSPLTIFEFLFSTLLLGVVKMVLVGVVLGALAFLLYSFDIFSLGFALIPFLLNLLVFGWTVALFSMAIILRFGTSAQVLAFGFLLIIQPFSAVFYPVSVLPQAIQFIAYLLPPTYVFEGMRAVLAGGSLSAHFVLLAAVSNALFLVVVMTYFYRTFNWVKKKGRLLKLD